MAVMAAKVQQEVSFRFEAETTEEFLGWATGATYGDWCVYHRGNLAQDRAQSPALCRLADTVLLLQGTGLIIATHHRNQRPGPTNYIATKSGRGYAPKSIIQGSITAEQWRALDAIRAARHGRSITRVIRDVIISSSDIAAKTVFEQIRSAGWIEEDPEVAGWKISRAGRSMLK